MLFFQSLAGRLPLLSCLVVQFVYAVQLVQVDDDDSAIVYTPADSWHRSPTSDPLDAGGRHMVTVDPAAQATFQFTGVGIAFMAPKWADSVTTQVSLDGGAPVLIDLVDPTQTPEVDGPATLKSSVVWQAQDLENTQHTLVISVPSSGRFAVVDMLIVSIPDGAVTTTSTTRTSTTSTTSTSTRTRSAAETSVSAVVSSSTKAGLSIAIGTVCAVFGLFVIGGLFWLWRRRQQQKKDRELWARSLPAEDPQPTMSEFDDGITAPPSRRYRSIPSLNALRASSAIAGAHYSSHLDTNSEPSNTPSQPSRSAKQSSKLRQVVATDEGASQAVALHTPSENSNVPSKRVSSRPHRGPSSEYPRT